jgi:hypothetical protein
VGGRERGREREGERGEIGEGEEEALLFKQAAKLGHARAQYQLGKRERERGGRRGRGRERQEAES